MSARRLPAKFTSMAEAPKSWSGPSESGQLNFVGLAQDELKASLARSCFTHCTLPVSSDKAITASEVGVGGSE